MLELQGVCVREESDVWLAAAETEEGQRGASVSEKQAGQLGPLGGGG